MNTVDFPTIEKLASHGFDFARTDPGMTRSNMVGWHERATNDLAQLREWHEQGYSFTSVAKRGRGFAVDVDDLEACLNRGFNPEWMDGYFAVETPSGGRRFHGLQDSGFDSLPNVVNVYAVPGDKKSRKILELKVDKASVAAPTVERIGQPNKCDGVYQPVKPVNGRPKLGLHPEFFEWLKANAETKKLAFAGSAHADWKWHPTFTVDRFLEDNDCTLYVSGMFAPGSFVVVPEDCPLCGRQGNHSTLAAGVTKFFFSGRSYGFTCKACGVDSRDEFEEKMAELHADFDPWSQYTIYEHDDPEIVRRQDEELLKAMGVESLYESQAAEPELAEPTKKSKAVDYTYESQDTGNGERLVRKFGESIRWIAETGTWMVWGEHGWREDTTGALMRMSKEIVKELVTEAKAKFSEVISAGGDLNSDTVKEAKALLAHAKQSGRIERRKAMIASAGFEKGIHTNITDWDSDIWLLNVKNGVIDLKTQTFRERTKADLCLKQSPIVYDRNATCRLFESAMRKWSMDDESWQAFVQQSAGISLTGDVSLASLFFCQGGGQNGKDTFFSVMRYSLGTYCKDVPFATFAETKNHSEHRNDLAALAGAVRMITTAESTDGHALDEGIVKLVTGGSDSKITCREIYGKPFTYTPQFTPWFMSNYEPVVKGGDYGIWRRVKKIPWDYTVTEAEKDADFGDKLKAEAAGVLNWMLRGLHDLLANGKRLPPCKRCEEATNQYRKDMDTIGRFVLECLEFKQACSRIKGQTVYKSYSGWSKENGHVPMNSRRFHAEFKKRLGSKGRPIPTNSGLSYEGFDLKVNDRGMEMEEVD